MFRGVWVGEGQTVAGDRLGSVSALSPASPAQFLQGASQLRPPLQTQTGADGKNELLVAGNKCHCLS